MRPLIKWAGGKSSEIEYIQHMIPKFDRYFEPFFGGGALFFHLEPKNSVVNDISEELMMFYTLLKNQDPEFKTELNNFVKYWNRIKVYMDKFGDDILDLYEKFRHDKIDNEEFEAGIKELFDSKIVPFNGLFAETFCISQKSLLEHIEQNLLAKLERTKTKVDVKNDFTDKMVMMNIETAFRSGFYMHFRAIMNKTKRKELRITDAKRIAIYYFVREFCFGSMFRFNDSGDFNIPYGGIAYNKKNFKRKVDLLFSDGVRRLLKGATIESADFEAVLKKHKPKVNDFVFLDPPYDTEFSEYEENPFDKKDQERLADVIYDLDAKFILIIKETTFIRRLYDNDKFSKRGIRVQEFGKTYTYNVKGRNEREVKHLIVHNIGNGQKPTLNMFL